MLANRGRTAIVVGAGIGGLSTAIALRRVGIEATVCERASELREVGSGLTLWVNAMRALDKLCVADAVAARGAVVERLENRLWRGEQLQTLPIGELGDRYGTHNVSIHRAELQGTLAAALDDGAVRLGMRCEGFAQDRDGVEVRFADGSVRRTDLLIGADGINSAVRAALHGDSAPRYAGYTCWRSAATIDHPLLAPTVYTQLYGPGATFGVFPIGRGMVSWYGTLVTPEGGGPATAAERKREAQRVFADWYEPVRAVIDATDEAGFVRQDIYDRRPIDRWGAGRVTLVGDAAHPTTPTLGQGGCMAIEDAVVLAKSLSLGGDIPIALRQFESQRAGRTGGIVRQARRHGVFYHGANPALRAVRDRFLKAAPVRVAMQQVDKLMGYEA